MLDGLNLGGGAGLALSPWFLRHLVVGNVSRKQCQWRCYSEPVAKYVQVSSRAESQIYDMQVVLIPAPRLLDDDKSLRARPDDRVAMVSTKEEV